MFATGGIHSNTSSCLCVAIKRHIVVYELNRTKFRHLKIKVGVLMVVVRKGRIKNLLMHITATYERVS